ncbi:MAG TPA: hypothetical protein VI934_05010 [Candidatus Nanoarchaeia archaeon]|nr:hypothetical protein [Candidatus Nanoarchaeia archaeon]
MEYYKLLVFFIGYIAAWTITGTATSFRNSGKETLQGLLLHVKSLCFLGVAFIGTLMVLSSIGKPVIQRMCDVEFNCGVGYGLIALGTSLVVLVPIWLYMFNKIASTKRKEVEIRWNYATAFNIALVVGAIVSYLI